jgi:hypothetical protein
MTSDFFEPKNKRLCVDLPCLNGILYESIIDPFCVVGFY